MQRRSFLGLTAATLALSFDAARPRSTGLDAAIARASAAGKALLVVVVPDGNEAAKENGRLFGQLVSRGSDHDLAALATCEVACVRAAQLKDLGALPRDAFLALVVPWAPRPLVGSLRRRDVGDDLGGAVRDLIFPDPATVQARMMRCIGVLGERAQEGIRFHAPAARPRLADVDRSAPLVYASAVLYEGELRALWLERLAYATSLRLWERAPEGATWSLDPDPGPLPDPCPPCGLAVIPEPTRDFLELYTR